MDFSRALVVYREGSTDIIMGACGGSGHRVRYRDRCSVYGRMRLR